MLSGSIRQSKSPPYSSNFTMGFLNTLHRQDLTSQSGQGTLQSTANFIFNRAIAADPVEDEKPGSHKSLSSKTIWIHTVSFSILDGSQSCIRPDKSQFSAKLYQAPGHGPLPSGSPVGTSTFRLDGGADGTEADVGPDDVTRFRS